MASDSWQSAWVEVLPDFKEFRSKANSQMSGILGDAGDTAGATGGARMNKGILGSVGKLALPLAGAFAALGIGQMIGDAVTAGFDYAVEGLDLASSLQQSQGAVEAVFGEASAAVTKFSDTSVNDLGLTENAYNELATVLGSQLKNGGTAIDALADKTNGLIGLGADLSAQYGGSTTDAVNALSAAFRGERDTIEKYGVTLTQAGIDAKAAELGFEKVGGALSVQASQAATLALVMDQTASAQGRFAAESDTLAGQNARLSASFEEAKTKLGTALLPAMTELATFANTTLVPMLDGVIDQVGPVLADALVQSVPAFTELILAIAPLLPDLVRLGVELLPLFIDALILMAPLLIDAANNSAVMTAGIAGVLDLLNGDTTLVDFGTKVLGMSGIIRDAALGIAEFAVAAQKNFTDFATTVGTSVTNAVGFVASLPTLAVTALGDLGATLTSSGAALIQGFIDGIENSLGDVGVAIGGVMDFAAGFFPHSPAERGPFSGSGWSAIKSAGLAVGDQFASGLDSAQSRMDLSMSSLVNPRISAPRLDASVYGSSGSAASAGASGPLVVQNYNGVPNQSMAELAQIAANERNEALRSVGV